MQHGIHFKLIELESLSSYSVDHFNYIRRYNKLSHSHIVKLPTDNMILIWLHPSGTAGILSELVDVTAESEQDYLMINVMNMRTTHFL